MPKTLLLAFILWTCVFTCSYSCQSAGNKYASQHTLSEVWGSIYDTVQIAQLEAVLLDIEAAQLTLTRARDTLQEYIIVIGSPEFNRYISGDQQEMHEGIRESYKAKAGVELLEKYYSLLVEKKVILRISEEANRLDEEHSMADRKKFAKRIQETKEVIAEARKKAHEETVSLRTKTER